MYQVKLIKNPKHYIVTRNNMIQSAWNDYKDAYETATKLNQWLKRSAQPKIPESNAVKKLKERYENVKKSVEPSKELKEALSAKQKS